MYACTLLLEMLLTRDKVSAPLPDGGAEVDVGAAEPELVELAEIVTVVLRVVGVELIVVIIELTVEEAVTVLPLDIVAAEDGPEVEAEPAEFEVVWEIETVVSGVGTETVVSDAGGVNVLNTDGMPAVLPGGSGVRVSGPNGLPPPGPPKPPLPPNCRDSSDRLSKGLVVLRVLNSVTQMLVSRLACLRIGALDAWFVKREEMSRMTHEQL